jgi:hypothetical protein
MDIDSIFYAGASSMNGLEPEYVFHIALNICSLSLFPGRMRMKTM